VAAKAEEIMNLTDIDYSKLPESLQGGAKRYIEHGILPGNFLQAVICNDLIQSLITADLENRKLLFKIVSFWYTEAPSTCWGSWEKMKEWIKHNGLEDYHE